MDEYFQQVAQSSRSRKRDSAWLLGAAPEQSGPAPPEFVDGDYIMVGGRSEEGAGEDGESEIQDVVLLELDEGGGLGSESWWVACWGDGSFTAEQRKDLDVSDCAGLFSW